MDKTELPWRCQNCHKENMVDFDNLSTWPVDKIYSAKGFKCCFCGSQEAVIFMTLSLKDKQRKLLRYTPEHRKFNFLFHKLLKKAAGVNQRGVIAYGTRKHKNMASSG